MARSPDRSVRSLVEAMPFVTSILLTNNLLVSYEVGLIGRSGRWVLTQITKPGSVIASKGDPDTCCVNGWFWST